jgi:hypothetical protein
VVLSVNPRELPKLIDCAGLQRELGVGRAAAEQIMRELPKVMIPGHSKVYVKRAAVQQLLDDNTVEAISARARKRQAAA